MISTRTSKEDLARRAVACRHWQWMPGMLTQHGRICGEGYLVSDDLDEAGQPYVDCTDTIVDFPGLLPDLDDPATVGCLLALVREALPNCAVRPIHTEAEALVSSLVAASVDSIKQEGQGAYPWPLEVFVLILSALVFDPSTFELIEPISKMIGVY